MTKLKTVSTKTNGIRNAYAAGSAWLRRSLTHPCSETPSSERRRRPVASKIEAVDIVFGRWRHPMARHPHGIGMVNPYQPNGYRILPPYTTVAEQA